MAFHDAEPAAGSELPPEIRPITPAQADETRAFEHDMMICAAGW